jgi:DNA-binding response OmpR family regulator
VSGCALRPVCCETFAAARALLAREQFSMVFFEDPLQGGDFHAVIDQPAQPRKKKALVIVISRRDDWDSYLTALGAGAFDYVVYPPSPGEIERTLYAALSESRWSETAVA